MTMSAGNGFPLPLLSPLLEKPGKQGVPPGGSYESSLLGTYTLPPTLHGKEDRLTSRIHLWMRQAAGEQTSIRFQESSVSQDLSLLQGHRDRTVQMGTQGKQQAIPEHE